MPLTFDSAAAIPALELAGIVCALGLLLRSQLMLRLTILLGAAYALIFGDLFTPAASGVKEAGFVIPLLAAAAAIGLLTKAIQSLPFALSPEARALRDAAPGLPVPLVGPLMEAGRVVKAAHETPLTVEGRRADALFLVLSGRVRLNRGREAWERAAPCFVGGSGWLLGRPSETTAHLAPGSRCVVWSRMALEGAARRRPAMTRALEGAVAVDMAARRKMMGAPEGELFAPQAPEAATPVPARAPRTRPAARAAEARLRVDGFAR